MLLFHTQSNSFSRKRLFLVVFVLLLAIVLVAISALGLGVGIRSWFELLTMISSDEKTTAQLIVFELRMPRVILSLLVGAALSLSGAVMQGIFRNPLADPGLVGVSAGAALGASVAVVLGAAFPIFIPEDLLVSLFAFVFGLLAMIVVYSIAKQGQHTQVATLLLAGVALSSMCTAISALMIYLSNDQQLRTLNFWQLGSFSGASWSQVGITAIVTLPASLFLWKNAKHLNVLLLGETQAKHLGVEVETLKRNLLIMVSLVVGVSVSMVGLIGFVGLIIPHIIRLFFGADHRFLLPVSYFLGALFLLLTDTLARTIISPAELPIGILTALVGCPFFIYLLLEHRKKILF